MTEDDAPLDSNADHDVEEIGGQGRQGGPQSVSYLEEATL